MTTYHLLYLLAAAAYFVWSLSLNLQQCRLTFLMLFVVFLAAAAWPVFLILDVLLWGRRL